MGITHTKVLNGIADGVNTSIVMPSDWNAGHVITFTQVEVDFGNPSYVDRKRFTIVDTSASATSKIMASPSLDAPTGKQSDELEMDNIMVTAGNCSTQSFDVLVTGSEGFLHDKFKINYFIG